MMWGLLVRDRLGPAAVAAAILRRGIVGLPAARVVPLLALRLALLAVALRLTVLRMLLVLVMLLLIVLLLLTIVFAIGADHPVVVLSVLIEILRRDPVACGARITGHRQIFLQDLIGVAADADIGASAVECLRALRHVWFTAVVAATLTLHVWTGSHGT